MTKRVVLFLATNLAIILMLSLIVNLLSAAGYIRPVGSRQSIHKKRLLEICNRLAS